MAKGYLKAPIAYKSMNNKSTIVYGLEEKKLYEKNFKALYNLVIYFKFTDIFFKKLDKKIVSFENNLYSPELKDLNKIFFNIKICIFSFK